MSWVREVRLDGATIFLSASFPSGKRATRFPTHEPNEVADATSAVVRAVLAGGGLIVMGGHPTITPLVLMVAGEIFGEASSVAEAYSTPPVIVYQSELFKDSITEATRALEQQGYGEIRRTPVAEDGDLDASLASMRETMLSECPPRAAFFVGGMEGIRDEYHLAARLARGAFCGFPLRAAGGAARTLRVHGTVPPDVRQLVEESRSYPAAVHAALAALE